MIPFGAGYTAELQPQVAAVCNKLRVDPRSVRSLLLLNLLQYAVEDAADPTVVAEELSKVAARVASRCAAQRSHLDVPPVPFLDRHAIQIHVIDAGEGRSILSAFHFLGYARDSGEIIGLSLKHKGAWRLAALTSFSTLDLDYLKPLLGESARSAFIVTRLYSFPWAPPNTLTCLLGALGRRLRNADPSATLLTFCNPNAGHQGTVYLAAGWSLFARQRLRRIYYHEGHYVSVRQALDVARNPQSRLTGSRQPLSDLTLFCRFPAHVEPSHAAHALISPAFPELERQL
jgi:hypothetical protein